MTDVPGVHPSEAEIECANCGYEYSNNHCNIAPNAQIPVTCPECESGGTVLHNKFSYVSGAYGAVTVSKPEGDA